MLNTRDTQINKRQENTKFSNRNCHIQDIKYVKYKNIDMNGDYWKFPRHLVAAQNFETRGINTIIFHYHFMVDPEVGKCVCDICRILCACPACVAELE